ncbi:MAG TPA: LPS export ABC transporter ATP-binding protein [Gemmatales bacterium]|nr:LPS export ABC transporter ATP-binding protein [Gemmatales bacterium]HMP61279.1 LPS export ABC transporter ATP-binding protein [Gemmatales bacterium]
MALLEVRNLVKYYGRRKVVNGVSFDVNPGEVVGLLGPNGAGKTTSFRMTTGMISPYSGQVTFAGQDVTHWPMYKRAQLGMGYLSQESSVFRKLTVEQNILAVLEVIPRLRSLGRRPNRSERWRLTEQVLEKFGLLRLRKNVAGLLSGGEKRRLEIARCLVCEPLLIMLDEPFTGIDPITISDIQGIVRDLRAHGIGLLLTDHNVREALKITDRSYVITEGTVEAHGTPAEIVRHPIVIAKYLGASFVEDARDMIAGPPLPTPSVAPAAVAHAAPAPRTIPGVLPQGGPRGTQQALLEERIALSIDGLKSAERTAAEHELLQFGSAAVGPLLEAMGRRDLEVRRLAFDVLARILGGGEFDPYAPEAQRRQQIEVLRQRAQPRAAG